MTWNQSWVDEAVCAQVDPELWAPVVGWEGLYEVSSHGRVRSIDRITGIRVPGKRKGQMLRQKMHQIHPRVTLCRGGADQQHGYCVHRLVCEAFHGPPPSPKHCVRHINGVPTDNRVENLAWGTYKENSQDMVRHGNAYWSRRSHCKNGHEFTDENTRVSFNAKGIRVRNCRACARDASRRKSAVKVQERLENRPWRTCVVCSKDFQGFPRAIFCCAECKRVSRTVEYKRKTQR